MKQPVYCYWTVNHRKRTAEVYGPTLALATKCAEALGGKDIRPVSSCDTLVTFDLPDVEQ